MQQFSTVEVVTIFVFCRCIYHSFGKCFEGSHNYWRGLTNHHFGSIQMGRTNAKIVQIDTGPFKFYFVFRVDYILEV